MTRVAVVVGIVLISLYGAGRLWVVWSIPTMHGTEPVPGLADSVVVLWDSLAVPHLIAQNDSDFFTALGYLHARDRMWQMDLLRHVAQGRLSEIFGRRLLTEDIGSPRTTGHSSFACCGTRRSHGSRSTAWRSASCRRGTSARTVTSWSSPS
jgi:acyl-homoserine lactone acylase PvdQ